MDKNKIQDHMEKITKVSNYILQQKKKGPSRVLVTNSDGKFIGVIE